MINDTVNIIDFKASGRRGRPTGTTNYLTVYRTWEEFFQLVTEAGAIGIDSYIYARFELEPEPVKLPDDRWAVVNPIGDLVQHFYKSVEDANAMVAQYPSYRVVRVVFREIDDARP